MKNKIFLLDAYALIFRSYYAFIKNPRINSKGLNTSAIFGFVNTLEEVLNKEKPSHIAVVFDPSGPNFRHEIFPEYKANREATPEDIKLSVPYIKQILEAYKIPVIQVSGYEADDVIGTLAKKFGNAENDVFMMTPDKDYAQLIDENIFMFKPARGGKAAEVIGLTELNQQYGVSDPEQVIDILALWGDTSDNVPGVPGIGEKTASKLIDKFGNIDSIYANIHKIVGKQKESLEKNKEQLYLSRHLVTIDTKVPVETNMEELKLEEPDFVKLNQIFDELEFRTLKNRVIGENIKQVKQKTVPNQGNLQLDLFSSVSNSETAQTEIPDITTENRDVDYKLIETLYEIEELIPKLNEHKEICLDTETTSLDIMQAEIVGISLSVVENQAYFIILPQDFDTAKEILEMFNPIFQNKEKVIIGQNLKFDLAILDKYGINVKAQLFDTMIAHYLIEPEQKHGIDFLAATYLNYTMISYEDLVGKGKNEKHIRDVDTKLLSFYACEDADITLKLKNIFTPILKENNLEPLFFEVEMPLVKVLANMEKTGVSLDVEIVKEQSQILRKELLQIEEKIYELAGETFNIASPKQLGIILFEKLKIISNPKKTKTKQYSTGEEELLKLKDLHPIINEILEFRSINKLINTYVDVLPQLVNPKTNKIHTSFNQTVTSTGRLSSNNPNLQNIPIRDERGRELRKAFVASDSEHVFLSADYSQIELRIMAHVSEDKNMLDAFNKFSTDIHSATAAQIFKVDAENVTREMRNQAKTANFGIIYGISAFGLAQRLNISRTDAKTLIDNYFETFPGVKAYMEASIAKARENQYVETIFGRRRKLADINSNNTIVRSYAERNAINAPIQGSAADIIKLAMVNICKKFEENNLKSKMILQVHDELNFDVYKPELEQVKQIVKDEMQNVVTLKVPLIVEIGVADNWLEAH